ncbi:MAG: aldehyde ferredoxin oxidoreductase C-terminal domain-containing protein, partial [Thermodesulfobacteriota bacterium]
MTRCSHGWAGSILRVDLSTGKLSTEPTWDYVQRFVGGRGLDQWVLFRELSPDTDPMGPDNRVILSTGPLTGTFAPGSGRLSAGWKNPQTGGVGSANGGGHFASELKFAGFDAVIIQGTAERPVYLLIEDGGCRIVDARHLWGRDVWETEDALRAELGNPQLRVASIGPAGEHQVLGAALLIDRSRAVGRGGIGAVLGSKKLKAIAVRGSRPVTVCQPQLFFDECLRAFEKLRTTTSLAYYRMGGTLTGIAGRHSASCVRNHQAPPWEEERVQHLHWTVFRDRYEVRRFGCFNCPISCSHYFRVEDGPYRGTEGEGLELNAIRGLGQNFDIDNPAFVIQANTACNRLGLDVDFVASTLGWAFECYDRGLLGPRDTDGMELVWGNEAAVLRMIEMLARREGIGDLLADGPMLAARTLGAGALQRALCVKGAPINEARMRQDKAWALGICAASRGGGHLEGAPFTSVLREQLTPELSMDLFGVLDIGDAGEYEHKERVVFWQERIKAITDCLGVCYFLVQWLGLDLLNLGELARLFAKATGFEMGAEDLMLVGQRVRNVERAFNILHAKFGRGDDQPPVRFMTERIPGGPDAGAILKRR